MSKNLDVFTLTTEQREYLLASESKVERVARTIALKLELMGVAPAEERDVVTQLARQCIFVSNRVKMPKRKDYHEKWRGFNNEFDMTFKILAYNEINNNYYSMLKSQVESNTDNRVIEIHRLDSNGFYELGNIYPLYKDDHSWAHGTEIKTSYVEDGKFYISKYDSLMDFYKVTEVSKKRLSQALSTDNQIEINGKQCHIKIVNHKITTDIPAFIESYKQAISTMKSFISDENRASTLRAIGEYEQEIREYEKILEHAASHNTRMEQFKGTEVYDLWNETATKLKQPAQIERTAMLETLIDEFTARDTITFELDELHNDTNLALLELERMQMLDYLKYEQVDKNVRIYDVNRLKLQKNKYRIKNRYL